MAFPGDWSRKCKLTIDPSMADAALTNKDILLTEATLPTGVNEMFDADGTYPAVNGGGDLRFFSKENPSDDTDGRLSCDIRSFVIDNNPANGTAVIFVKIPTISSVADTDIWVFWGAVGESQPAVDAAYGRDDVWSQDFVGVWHMDESSGDLVDSAGNIDDMADANSPTYSQTGKFGDAIQFTRGGGANDDANFSVADAAALDIGGDVTLSAWLNGDDDPQEINDQTIAGKNDGNYVLNWRHDTEGYRKSFSHNDAWPQCGIDDDLDAGTWYFFTGKHDGSNTLMFLNDTQEEILAADDPVTDNSYFSIGGYQSGYYGFNGLIQEVRLSNVARTAAWIKADYRNQSAPATYIVEGTPGDVAAGPTYTLTAVSGSYALTGQTANLFKNCKINANAGSYTLTGQTISLLYNRLLSDGGGVYTLTGQNAAFLYNRLLSAATGAYTVTGQAAALLYNRYLSAGAGSYALTGQDVSFLRNYLISAGAGSYILTGQDATLTHIQGNILIAEAGSYIIIGSDATLKYNRLLTADAGAYTLTGQTAALFKNSEITAGAGSYIVIGQDTTFRYNRIMTAEPESFTVTGQAAALLYNRYLSASAGSYALIGQDVSFLRNYLISTGGGSYILTGQDVTLNYSGYVLPTGQVVIAFSVKKPGSTFTAKKPGGTFTAKKPSITFT